MGFNTRRRNRSTRYAEFDDEDDDEFVIDDDSKKDTVISDINEPSEEFEDDVHDADVKPATIAAVNDDIDANPEDDDEEDHIKPRTRHIRVNYNEDEKFADIDDIVEESDKDDELERKRNTRSKLKNDDDYEYEEAKSNRRKRSSTARRSDDEEFEDSLSDGYDEDDLEFGSLNKRTRRSGFVVEDEDGVENDDYAYGSRNTSRRSIHRQHTRNSRLNRRNRLRELSNHRLDENTETLTLEDEIRELRNDSPLNSPKRNLRDRRHVNYTLPPPELNEQQLEELQNGNDSEVNASPRRGRNGGRYGGAHTQATSVRRLFPTVGPFGGGDVHALFQNETIPSGLAALANADSSDSEDENDLIKPTDPNDVSNIITANDSMLANGVVQKKKNTLADTDPLGIDTNIDFSVVGGLDNFINQLKEMITLPLLYPEVYSKFHITPPRGVLFHGPPGTGKTLMARALAASCSSQNKKITFFMRKGADCLSKWVGEAERHLRLLFEEAKQHQPSIIFFDEIDGLAPVRSSKQEQIHASIVSTLLALMDGMDNRGQVIIIGATNRPDSIDPALRRPGRFDREFYFPLPDLKAREDILKIHMRKWDNQLDDQFIKQLAVLTKGYGGADLRALCTESALNSIQRTYPQIYKTNDKLKIDISRIKATASDFTRALKKIVPNSARSTNSVSEPLPEFVKPLLEQQFFDILQRLKNSLPMEKELSLLDEAEFISLNDDFQIQQAVKTFDTMRVFKPRLAICGLRTQGLKYLSNAVLNMLEGFTVQVLDLGKLYSDSSISTENLCIQLFSELKRHKPSILFIPDTLGLLTTVTESLKATIRYLVRSINNNDKILIYCEIEGDVNSEIFEELDELFDINEDNCVVIRNANESERRLFFDKLWSSIDLTPNEYNDLQIRPKRQMKQLEVVKSIPTEEEIKKSKSLLTKSEKNQAKTDMRLKNTLKVRLSGLLDIFKTRYKRFKKPIIDDMYLVHLFDETPDPTSNYQIKDGKILEVSTGKLYHNIDLDIIEERLWNGFYNEPREFLHDLEMILKDANTSGERDRVLKANEMYAHAVVGLEEIEVQFPALVSQWKELGIRERQRKNEYLKLQAEKKALEIAEMEKNVVMNPQNVIDGDEKIESIEERTVLRELDTDENAASSTIEGQTQVQSQLLPGEPTSNVLELPVKPVVVTSVNEEANGEIDAVTEQSNMETQSGRQLKNIGTASTTTAIENTESATGESSAMIETTIEPSAMIGTAVEPSFSDDDDKFVPEKQNVIYDRAHVERLRNELVAKTVEFTITRLERLNSQFCRAVWEHRLELDKTALLEHLERLINDL
ncbi:hypothetical protein CANINC_003313 [Pichia inconspicua]|uniref:Bromo domain-containing protein n=1 Tax=Pichia inconspicua TaxID=52247 RepID=A0A4V4NFH2_9ASCO|nr:hypothetical protein CANINC_003313 [[Candida] inconspicua]